MVPPQANLTATSQNLRSLQIVQPPQRLESLSLPQAATLAAWNHPWLLLLKLLLQCLNVLDVANPDSAHYLVQPACLHIYSSLTVLRLTWQEEL